MPEREAFDRYANRYDALLRESLPCALGDTDRFALYKVDILADRLAGQHVESVLDFGCGPGRSLGHLHRAFPFARLYGFDPSPECAVAAGQHCPRAEVTADFDILPVGSFDCILAANVLHHVAIGDRLQTLARCATALRPGGSLFVFEHNPFNPLTRWIFERCAFDVDATMIRRRELVESARAAGLLPTSSRYTLFLPSSGRAARIVQRALGWLPLGAQYYVQLQR